jgi:hypothetical protein
MIGTATFTKLNLLKAVSLTIFIPRLIIFKKKSINVIRRQRFGWMMVR